MRQLLDPLKAIQLNELKIDIAKVVKKHPYVYILETDDEDTYIAEMKVNPFECRDDRDTMEFKHGDNFKIKVVNGRDNGNIFVKYNSARVSIYSPKQLIVFENESGELNAILKQENKVFLLAGRQNPIEKNLREDLFKTIKPYAKWSPSGDLKFAGF